MNNIFHNTLLLAENATSECDVPCKKITYSADLSYAVLSPQSVIKLWNTQPEKKAKAVEQYRSATELVQRVNPDIVKADTISYNSLEEYVDAIIDILLGVCSVILRFDIDRSDLLPENIQNLLFR